MSPAEICNACGLPVNPQADEYCPRCHYPLDSKKEREFLEASIEGLQRVAKYGGKYMPVDLLIARYQSRLGYLRSRKSIVPLASPLQSPAFRPVAPQLQREPVTAAEHADEMRIPTDKLAQPRESATATTGNSLPARVLKGALQEAPQHIFSWRAFLIENVITIATLLGTFILAVGALVYIVSAYNPLQTFLVLFGLHAFFGVATLVFHRLSRLRALVPIYSIVYAFLVPVVGIAAFSLISGESAQQYQWIVPPLTSLYASIVFCALAVNQRYRLFGYLGIAALEAAALSVAHAATPTHYYWWVIASMLVALCLLGVMARLNRAAQSSAQSRLAILLEPVRVVMIALVGLCAVGTVLTALYSIYSIYSSAAYADIRGVILAQSLLLLAWSGLFFWIQKRTQELFVLPVLVLACVLAVCYMFSLRLDSYTLVLAGTALVFHLFTLFTRLAPQHLRSLGNALDLLAIGLSGLVLMLGIIAFGIPPSAVWQSSQIVVEHVWMVLLAALVGSITTASVAVIRARHAIAFDAQVSWPRLLLLSGAMFTWGYGVVVTQFGLPPSWAFAVLTIAVAALAIIVRARAGSRWADPLDALALAEAIYTVALGGYDQNLSWLFLLFFAALSYGMLLSQRRKSLLFIPCVFALLVPLALFTRPHLLLLFPLSVQSGNSIDMPEWSILHRILLGGALLFPLAAAAMRRVHGVKTRTGTLIDWRQVPAWEWPLLVTAFCYALALLATDLILYYQAPSLVGNTTVPMLNWFGVPAPLAIEAACIALSWYCAAAITLMKPLLIGAAVFALAAVAAPGAPFLVLTGIVCLSALFGLVVGRLAGRDWALPLYSTSLLGAAIAGFTGSQQVPVVEVTLALFVFAVLAYAVGVVERTRLGLWLAPALAFWSLIESGPGPVSDLYRLAIVFTCVALGVIISRFKRIGASLEATEGYSRACALSFYATGIVAALVTARFATDTFESLALLLLYAALAYGVALYERRPLWVVFVPIFSVWGLALGSCASVPFFVSAGIATSCQQGDASLSLFQVGAGVVAGLLGLWLDRLPDVPRTEAQQAQRAPFDAFLSKLRWSWPWYVTMLCAIVLSLMNAQSQANLPGMLGMVAFLVVTLVIMLGEAIPELLLLPAALAVYIIGHLPLPAPILPEQLVCYGLLCILLYAARLLWTSRKPAFTFLPASVLPRLLGLGGLTLVLLLVIQAGGYSAWSGVFAWVGMWTLLLLACLLMLDGRLSPSLEMRHWWYYTGGLLLSLIVPWMLQASYVTNVSLLTLAPASYLAMVVAPFMMRDVSIKAHESMGKLIATLGSALLLLPTLFLSFGSDPTSAMQYVLILIGEAAVLLVLGLTFRSRVFVLSGTALVVIGVIRLLYVSLQGNTGLFLMVVGMFIIALSTMLVLVRYKLREGWRSWA